MSNTGDNVMTRPDARGASHRILFLPGRTLYREASAFSFWHDDNGCTRSSRAPVWCLVLDATGYERVFGTRAEAVAFAAWALLTGYETD